MYGTSSVYYCKHNNRCYVLSSKLCKQASYHGPTIDRKITTMDSITMSTNEVASCIQDVSFDSLDDYCRLCAQLVPPNKQVNLRTDKVKREEVITKLTRINTLIDFNDSDLPTAVCFECCSTLQEAYTFVSNIDRATATLNTLKLKLQENHGREDPIKIESNDDQQDYYMDLSPFPNETDDNYVRETPIKVKSKVKPLKNGSRTKTSSFQSQEDVNNISDNKNDILLPVSVTNSGTTTIQITLPVQIVPSISIINNEATEIDYPAGKTWKDYRWKCQLCESEYATCTELIEHSKSEHSRCNTFSCMDCNRKSSTLNVLLAHMYKTHIERRCLRLSCFLCFKPFKSPAERTAHQTAHIHYAYVCGGCNTEFRTSDELNDHKSKFFNSRNQYTKEALREFEGKFEGLTCLLCNKTLVTRNGLYTHLKIHYGKKHTCVCDVCGKGCENKTALKVHMISHTDERPFKCAICPDTFKTERALRKHVMAHDKQKRFACETCGKKFRLLQTLNAHKSIHSDTYPFVCDVCNKCFRCRPFLNRHMRQHTGEKPYSCEACNHLFTYWSNYNKHMTTVHGKDMSKRKRLEGDGGRLVKEINDQKLLEWMEKTLEGPSRNYKKNRLNAAKSDTTTSISADST